MGIDVEALRRETPGCAAGVVHLNNAGAALMPRPVVEALTEHIREEALRGGYEAEEAARPALGRFYAEAAALVGGSPEEIAFVDSATRAWQAVVLAIDWRDGDEVITCRSEYASHMIALLRAQAARGIVVRVAPDLPSGEVDAQAVAAMVGPRTRLICITHIPTNDGLVNPAEAVGAVARAHGVPFLLDACQSVGQMPIDVGALGCTMLSATGRKYLRGPRGTGFLWVARDWAESVTPPTLDVNSAEWTGPASFAVAPAARRFELWERSTAGQVGLGVACAYARATGVEAMAERILALAGRLRTALEGVTGVRVHDQGRRRSGIVTFSAEGLPAPEAVRRLREEAGINTSVSGVQATRQALHAAGLTQLVRASVHAYNTDDEIDRLVEHMGRLVAVAQRPARPRASPRPVAFPHEPTPGQGAQP